MGGLQLQRNFGLRSDLITHALPSASGTALVPSTVDVYVNNMRAYSQDVPSGPFRIANIPVAASNGTARIVVRDVSGRSSETTQNFIVSPNLLGKGVFDFSAQTGYARYDYGLQSHNYSNHLAAMASARYGLSNDFTLEAHTESTARFGLAGLGLVTALDKRHLFTIAGSFSQFEAQKGGQIFASYETNYKGFFLGFSTQRSLGNYMDLAAVTAKPMPLTTVDIANPLNLAGQGNGVISQYSSQNPFALSLLPMKAIDRATLGLPLAGLKASLNFSHVHMLSAENIRAHISSASLNMTLNAETSFFATAFMDRGDKRNYGLFAGLSMQLDKATYANLGLGNDRNGTTLTAELARPQSQELDTWGYRIRDMEGKNSYRTAQASYRSKVGLGEVTLSQQAQGAYGTAYIEGGLATAGGGVFATNRIDDGFAVVKTGVKNAEVFHENRLVGRTNEAGRLILPNLRSNETNRITLNPNSLPITAAIDTTKTVALPKDRGAVVVDFGVTEFPQAALVSFIDSKNAPISAGTVGTREDGTSFIVGHEGKSYLMKLNAQNSVTLKNEKMSCTASFAYTPENDKLVKIPHILCR
jgi:outer membrane usher protein